MNAVIYARFSSRGQTEQSIEGQLRVCHEYARREGYSVIGEYIDRAISGTTDERPDFQKMVSDAEKKQFGVVIVYKIDRFARNRYDSAIYKKRLSRFGVKVVSVTEPISEGNGGAIIEAVYEAMAEEYSRQLSQNVKRGLRESVLKGNFIGGHTPIGFKVINKKVYIDEETAPIIRYCFEEVAKGTPKKEIIEALNARGIRTKRGTPLSLSCFQGALRNKKYIGINTRDGVEYTNTYPVLIDPTLFYKVQEKLDARSHAPAHEKAREDYILFGKAFCGHCGEKLISNGGTGKLGKVYHYYACKNKTKRHACDKHDEKKNALERYVVEMTLKHVLASKNMDYIADHVVEENKREFGLDAITALEKRLDKAERELDKLTDALLDTENRDARKRIEAKMNAASEVKADIEVDLARMRVASEIRLTRDDVIAWLQGFTKGDVDDEEFRRRIIDVFINSVFVYDDLVVIYYNLRHKKKVTHKENRDAIKGARTGGRGVQISNAMPRQDNPNLNPAAFIFVGGIFGIVISRDN